jgi:hypothetical protein
MCILLQRTCKKFISHEHPQVSAWELQVWTTPEGVLAEEVGQGAAFKAEIVADKNVRKVSACLAPPCMAAACRP